MGPTPTPKAGANACGGLWRRKICDRRVAAGFGNAIREIYYTQGRCKRLRWPVGSWGARPPPRPVQALAVACAITFTFTMYIHIYIHIYIYIYIHIYIHIYKGGLKVNLTFNPLAKLHPVEGWLEEFEWTCGVKTCDLTTFLRRRSLLRHAVKAGWTGSGGLVTSNLEA